MVQSDRSNNHENSLKTGQKILGSLGGILLLVYHICRLLGGAIFVILLCCLIFGTIISISAFNGVISLLTGNGILRACHLAHYTHNQGAAQIGAIGGIFAGLLAFILTHFLNNMLKIIVPLWLSSLSTVAFGTLSGTVGCAVLLHNGVDLGGGMDILHATRAGALGGAIIAPGMIFFGPLMASLVTLFLTPPFLKVLDGIDWCSARLTEMTNNSDKYSICPCGVDLEDAVQQEELEAFQRPH